MKTAEELTALKNEVEVLNQKLSALTEEELEQVMGGNIEQEIKNLVKQHFQIEEEGSGEKFKDFLENMPAITEISYQRNKQHLQSIHKRRMKMKTEELNTLTDDELTQVTGGSMADSLKKNCPYFWLVH